MPAALLPVLALVLNAFIWGVSWWPFRQLQQLGLHPLWSTSLLYAVALLGLLLARPAASRGMLRQPGLWLLLLATGLSNAAFNWAVAIGDVVRVVLLFYLMPGWAVLLGWLVLGERPTRAALLRLVLALVGVLVVLWPAGGLGALAGQGFSAADALALLGGFSFALTNVQLRRLQHVPGTARMGAMFAGGVLIPALAASLGAQFGLVPVIPPLQLDWASAIAVMGLLFFFGNMGLQYGAARMSSANSSIVMLTEIVFASVSSVALGAATLSLRTLAGAALILLASVLAARSE
ncbi:MAG: EamA family transporter [Burkholderiales bacterium]|nr:EamA family transporter [Burkholderiales bacterium]